MLLMYLGTPLPFLYGSGLNGKLANHHTVCKHATAIIAGMEPVVVLSVHKLTNMFHLVCMYGGISGFHGVYCSRTIVTMVGIFYCPRFLE